MAEPDVLFQILSRWIMQLPRVTQAPHRFGGTEFRIDLLEFAHSHGTLFWDIRLSKEDQSEALKNGTALPHRFAPQAGWVSYRIGTEDDIETAEQLIRLAYENAKARMDDYATRAERSNLL